ncbi:hypothetical protein OAP47_01130 [Candidatus Pelagibacter sp.]|nr:hypothetical protein [Candidatus Pelagibacter sp.]
MTLCKVDFKIRNLVLRIKPKKNYILGLIVKSIYTIFNFHKYLYWNAKIYNKKNDLMSKSLKFDGFFQKESNGEDLNEMLEIHNNALKDNKYSDNKKFLKTFSIDVRKNENKVFLKFLFKNNILSIVDTYLGYFYTMNKVLLMHSTNTEFVSGRSQEMHVDGDITNQLKIFVHLSDIDNQSGPLSALNITNSSKVIKNLHENNKFQRISMKIPDNLIDKNYLNNLKIFTGKKGLMSIINTSRCLHFGSRPGNKERIVLMYQFLRSNNYRTRLFPNKQINLDIEHFNFNENQKINHIIRFADFYK